MRSGTKTQLAQELGVSVKRVTSAIERREIAPERVGVSAQGQRCIVDMDGAKADFQASSRRAAEALLAPALPDGVDVFAAVGDGMMPPPGVDLRVAQTIHQWWSAVRERARHEREAGEWVRQDDVKRAVFVACRAARDAILALPDRVADDLAAESEPRRVHDRLRAELQRILEDLAATLEVPEEPDHV